MTRRRPPLLTAATAKRVAAAKSGASPSRPPRKASKAVDPWVKHDGIFVGDPHFAEIVKDIARKRKKLKA